jgi:hypothetical protein
MYHSTLSKIIILTLALFSFVSQFSFGQAKKYVLMEEFTNADCAPCASQNPDFQANILDKNKGIIHEMSYHPWWPGDQDPMYLYNVNDITDRTVYYGISGVPAVAYLGSEQYSPSGITQSMINNSASEGSPLRILVSQTSNGQSRDVKVVVHTVGTTPSGNLKLFAAVVESEINYTTAPGSNGETYFPNVFRDMLPSTSGSTYYAANTGDSVVYTFNYPLDLANWDTSKIYVVAWVQDYSTMEVINSGSTNDPSWEFVTSSTTIAKPDSLTKTALFDFNVLNLSSTTGLFRVYVSFEQTAGWDAAANINGSWTYWNSTAIVSDSFDISVNANSELNNSLSVTANSAGVGTYSVRLKSLDNSEFADQEINFVVIDGVTDLVINNAGGWGDGGTYDFESVYTDALSYAGSTTHAALSSDWLVKANKANALTSVNNIYYNVAWTFPSFSDEIVGELESFMDNGGNLFVSGQDIGWDIMSGDGYGTSTTESFYQNYLHADYLSDGTSSNKTLTADTADDVFGNVSSSSISGVYGSSYIYPDQLEPVNNSSAIFYYNSSTSKIGGLRAEESAYKVVYIGVGMEMLSDVNVKNEILKLSYDWFYGNLSTIEFDQQMQSLSLGNNYPNPAVDFTIIPVNGDIKEESLLELSDLNGKVIATQIINPNTASIFVNTENYAQGTYFYRLRNNQQTSSGKIEVIR